MDHEPTDPLNDPALEREIESLLAVDPPPEFLARVRARLTSEPAPSSWGWSLGFGVAGAAAAVVLIAVLIAPWMRSTPTDIPRQATVTEDVTLEPLPPQPAAGVRLTPDSGRVAGGVRRVRQADAPRQAVQRVISGASPFAEVLISQNERRAFAMLLTTIEEGRLPPVPAAADQTASLEPP